MKLLFLAHRIPYPPNKGDKIRSYHELRALVERGHEVHLLAFADNVRDLQYQVNLARGCASVRVVRLRKFWARVRALLALLTSRPLSLGYFGSWKMRRLVNRALKRQQFDAVVVYSSGMAQYIPSSWRAKTIVDLVDVDSEKWREYSAKTSWPKNWLYSVESHRLREYEHEIVANFANSMLTTRREADLLSDLDEFTRRARVRIMTNGVDSDYFQPEPSAAVGGNVIRLPLSKTDKPISKPRLVFTGAMDYYANVEAVQWFAAEVFPLIRQQEPQAEFFIVGSDPTAEVRKLAEQPGIIVTGTVEDVRPYLRDAAVCVAPLRIARGIQNKILEAMAMARPVIASSECAAAVEAEIGQELLTSTSPADFIREIDTLLLDDALCARIGNAARQRVLSR